MPAEPRRAFAPGRVNLVGEHTDYNGGLCLPLAIEQGITVSAAPAQEPAVRAPAEGWQPYVDGVRAELQPEPAELEIGGDLPAGAGLGSSAALCIAVALALGADPGDPLAVARLCSRVEADWAGAHTGLLDQLASLWGRRGHAVRIDMRSLEAEPVALGLGGWTLAIIDSGSSRQNAASGYNERRRECAEACRLLGVESLREAGGDVGGLPEPLRSRARHVAEENERVDEAVAALTAGDLPGLAELIERLPREPARPVRGLDARRGADRGSRAGRGSRGSAGARRRVRGRRAGAVSRPAPPRRGRRWWSRPQRCSAGARPALLR